MNTVNQDIMILLPAVVQKISNSGDHYRNNSGSIEKRDILDEAREESPDALLAFARYNVLKYAKRYGKKEGYNRDDVIKIIHYAMAMLVAGEMPREKKDSDARIDSRKVDTRTIYTGPAQAGPARDEREELWRSQTTDPNSI